MAEKRANILYGLWDTITGKKKSSARYTASEISSMPERLDDRDYARLRESVGSYGKIYTGEDRSRLYEEIEKRHQQFIREKAKKEKREKRQSEAVSNTQTELERGNFKERINSLKENLFDRQHPFSEKYDTVRREAYKLDRELDRFSKKSGKNRVKGYFFRSGDFPRYRGEIKNILRQNEQMKLDREKENDALVKGYISRNIDSSLVKVYDEVRKKKNIKPLIKPREGIELKDFVAVHATDTFPGNGTIKTTVNYNPLALRDSIHFTLNGPVSPVLTGGSMTDWDDKKYAVLIPYEKIKDRVVAAQGQDTIVIGNLKLPKGSIIIADKSERENLNNIDTGDARIIFRDYFKPENLNQGKENLSPFRKTIYDTIIRLGYCPIQNFGWNFVVEEEREHELGSFLAKEGKIQGARGAAGAIGGWAETSKGIEWDHGRWLRDKLAGKKVAPKSKVIAETKKRIQEYWKENSSKIPQIYHAELENMFNNYLDYIKSDRALQDYVVVDGDLVLKVDTRPKRHKTLEHITSMTSILAFILSLFFLSSNMTGNVIGNSTVNNSLGVVLFIIGIIGAFWYFKKKA